MKSLTHFSFSIVFSLLISTFFIQAQNCEVPDNGTGTATLPPIGCQYQSVDPFMIIEGLPPGSTIELHGIYSDFICCDPSSCPCSLPLSPGECERPGGSLGGDGHCFIGSMVFDVIGTGELEGFNRTLFVEIFSEIHTGPRILGEPVQAFPAEYYRLQGELFGDPDFCEFRIFAGSDYGLPGPGNTTLTQLPSGDFAVDSFFDITYQIEFEGCPGSQLEGYAGTTISTTGFEIPSDFIDPGPDFWIVPESPVSSVHPGGPGGDFGPIPADFFGPGSDPFDGVIYLIGESHGSTEFPNADAIVERTSHAYLPEPYSSSDQVQTEIIELSLVSTAPITVTYNGGMDPELWEVELELSTYPQPAGNMDITKNDANGGVFDYSPLYVYPKLIFTQTSPPYNTWDWDLGGTSLLAYTNSIAYPWEHSPNGNDFNPSGTTPMELFSPGGDCELYLTPYLLRQDDFWVNVGPDGIAQGGGSGYNYGEWYYYPNTYWWNIWFYDHPYDPDRKKGINISFTISGSGNAEVVINWSTGDWAEQGTPGIPPLPEYFLGDPEYEDLCIIRSEPIFIGPVTGPTVVNQYFEIPEYNPEWISIDIQGMDFDITNGIIEHVCLQPESGGDLFEFGDAPEDALAYPSLGITGMFPTCMNVPISGWIQHNDVSAWFGSEADLEPDGNAGACPVFNPNQYNLDECFGNGDAGLMIPESFTITGAIGSETVVPCTGFMGMPLGYTCQQAEWGADIDIDIHNQILSGEQAYVNLLIDWNQDGQWAGSSTCPPGYSVPEHVLVDFVIPNGFHGPLSHFLGGNTFPIGPNPGYVWARFSITEMPVGDDWNGEGSFYYGETEDYLLLVEEQGELDWGDAPDGPYPTYGINNGAHHVIIPTMYLGNSIDGEPDGQPDVPAHGDDNDIFYPPANDDEDGVIFTSVIIPGQTVTLNVMASTPGFLNAWLDFHADGSWATPGDQIFSNVNLSAGNNTQSFTVPAGAITGQTYARFRFSSAQGIPFDGLAPDGEVEDYRVTIGLQTTDILIDFPDPAGEYVQNEISMAIVPGGTVGVPAVLLAAYNDHPYPGGPGLGVSYSNDGGATWIPQQLPYPPDPYGGGNFVDMFDPTATADANGNLYVAQISTDYDWTNGPASGLFVHKSTDGGVTWLPPVAVATDGPPVSNPDPNYRFNDRCQMTCDINPTSSYYNNLYIVEIKDRGWNNPLLESDIYFSASTDGGLTWSSQIILNENIHNLGNMPVPAVAPDGTIYVCWMDYNVQTGGVGTIYMNFSPDGGATWLTQDILVRTVNLPPLRLNGGTDVLAKGAAVIDVSPTNPQEVYIVYAEASAAGGDEGDIFFIRSTDGGQNWSAPLQVNDDSTPNDQVMPWIDVKPNGTIDVTWYDRRNDPLDLDWDVYIAMSTDGGNSFTPNVQINDVSAPSPNTPSGIWMGEYLGLIVDNTHAYIAFTSSLYDINGDVFFDKIQNPLAEIDFGDAPDDPYPTLLASDGARHNIDGVTFLGLLIDAEPDGQPHPNALGDDNNNLADEDGIVFNQIIQGSPAQITVTTSTAGYLQGWMDFNADGDWADAGEQIFTDAYIAFGISVCLNYTVPVYANIGTTFARFRFSTQMSLTYKGLSSDGEVEDYEVEIIENPDIKWLQEPCEQLPGLHCTDQINIIADDWECFGGLVTDIHWWGNYEDDVIGNGIDHFHLSIHDNDPANCLPVDTEIWGMDVLLASTNQTNTGLFNSEFGVIYEYTYYLDPPFEQIEGNTYWLDICAYSVAGDCIWRWQESSRMNIPILCSAASRTLTTPPWWEPIDWLTPPPTRYSDMAFMITSVEVEELDFGDAPDGFYPTLLISDGARHQIEAGFFLGASVDVEPNGQPHGFALGDDNDGNDDEDGVVFTTPLIPGQPASVNITLTDLTGVGGLLDAWIDFDHSGSFDAAEHLCSGASCSLTPGVTTTINFNVPAGIWVGPVSFARFRLSRSGGLLPTGVAPDGEVEDYRVFFVNPGNSKMHYPQLPDLTETGIDVDMYHVPLADDFLCTETGPISEIVMWGSFANDWLPDAGVGSLTFQLTIYSDIPAGEQQPWSMPGNPLWTHVVNPGEYTVELVHLGPEWWYDPFTYWWQAANHNFAYRYNFFFDDPFIQQLDNIYWLEIIDLPRPPPDPGKDYTFGWKTSTLDTRWNDDACFNWIFPDPPLWWVPGWNALTYPSTEPIHPYSGTTLDFAFIIKSETSMDFGDAPDPTYPTLLASDGARHSIEPGFYLGASVDIEADGQPNGHATGDDNDGNDDEDGIVFTTLLIPGQNASIDVTLTDITGGQGILDGWIDFDRNGVFDPAEYLFAVGGVTLNGGLQTVSFSVPAGATIGPATFARFRLSRAGGLIPSGAAPDGEVEDYRVFIVDPQGTKMHYPQPPDLSINGMDVDLFHTSTADDFMCTESGPITHVRIWTSFADDIIPTPLNLDTIQLIIHSDIPAGEQQPWSMPEDELWSKIYFAGQYSAIEVADDKPEWWYDPATQWWQPNNHTHVFRFDFPIDESFDQIIGTIYWLEVKWLKTVPFPPAPPDPMANTLGWKTTPLENRFNDDAVWWNVNNPNFPIGWVAHVYPGDPIPHPNQGESFDMSFVINPPEGILIDFGDANDPTYPTLSASNGAAHFIDGITYLGNLVDSEPDGQPTPDAKGDDNNGVPDDEDGVTFTSPIYIGQSATVDVVASVDGVLNAWMDFDGNGSWGDPGEQIFTDVALTVGINNLTYYVSSNAITGPSYTRFRFSTVSGLSFTGIAPDGEVEDYEVDIEAGSYKWAQYPNPEWPGIHAHDWDDGNYQAIVLADDWICEGGWVTDIHWWGNYEMDLAGLEWRGAGIQHFHLSIHAHDPTGCLPQDPEIWGVDVPFTALTELFTELVVNLEGSPIYLYEYDLVDPFQQIQGVQYWLDITAVCIDPQNPAHWRWQESARNQSPILCGAADKLLPNPGVWNTISWTLDRFSDMAFMITSEPAPDMDMGDADDPTYPTLLINNGAAHIIDGITYLGAGVDSEPDGQPTPLADGDDLDGNDDEDGVTINPLFSYLYPNGHIWYDVVASVDGILNVWIDWNANGSWGDAGEHVIVDLPATGPPVPNNTLLITIPPNAIVGNTYTRFRFSSVGGLSYTGMAPDGEVEDHELTIEGDLDFGDAPDQAFPAYPTLLANNGARHLVPAPPTVYLGSLIDFEPDGFQDPNALGDDNNNLADEDGVILPPSVIAHGQVNTITVIASADGILNGWMDFNIDGDWDEADEHIFMNQPLNAGNNTLNFMVPVGAFMGQTFARFRFSTVGGLSYTGYAQDGEVEDYKVEIGEAYKWIQEPDLTTDGMDVDATFDMFGLYPPMILADDFLCNITGPLTRIEIWGSWYHDILPMEGPGAVTFTLSIHKDIPAEQSPTGYSMPGEVLWIGIFNPYEFMFESYAMGLIEGWYNPALPLYDPLGDTECWRYIFDLMQAEPFIQEGTPDEPIIYWLDVQAQPLDDNPDCRFGWKTSVNHWNDDAVWTIGMEPYIGDWNELRYPEGHPWYPESIDLAFAIYGQENPYILVDLTAFLEGPFSGSDMQPSLNGANLIPLNQPYASDPAAKWYYTGTESVGSIPAADVVDWVMIELRDATSAINATGTTMIDEKAAFIKKDGKIVATDGTSLMKFYVSFSNNPYAVVWQRNHLGILSANPLNMVGFGLYRYDFTTGLGQAYLNGQKHLGGGIYGMMGGDGQPDGSVDSNDQINVWAPAAGTTGYQMGDYNMDTQVDNKDKNDVWYPNNGSGTQVPD